MRTIKEIAKIKRINSAKRGVSLHHGRLVSALSLLAEIQSPEFCEDESPFSCENYFPDADFYLGKAIDVIEDALKTLLKDITRLTELHIQHEEDFCDFCEQEKAVGGSDE